MNARRMLPALVALTLGLALTGGLSSCDCGTNSDVDGGLEAGAVDGGGESQPGEVPAEPTNDSGIGEPGQDGGTGDLQADGGAVEQPPDSGGSDGRPDGGAGDATPTCAFQIELYECYWHLLGGYTVKEFEDRLKKCTAGKKPLVVGSADIVSYDWTDQKVTLTADATTRLLASLPKDWVRSHGGNMAFVVTLKGAWLYAGVFYNEMGAAAIAFPVIHIDQANGQLTFRIKPGLNNLGSWAPIKQDKIKECFRGVGKLQ